LVAGLPARGEEPADAIQAVIADQLRAFEASNSDVAYSHASPGIQSKFRKLEIFGRIVATGYSVIWRPAGYEMLDLLDTATGPAQKVLLQDAQGRFFMPSMRCV
jgi:hypothetical protein